MRSNVATDRMSDVAPRNASVGTGRNAANIGQRSGAAAAGALRYRALAAAAMIFCSFVIVTSDVVLLALSAAIVFLTVPLYPFVMNAAAHSRRERGARPA